MSRAERRRKEREQTRRKDTARGGLWSHRTTRLVTLITAVALVLGLGAWGGHYFTSEPTGTDEVLRVVNGREITDRDLVSRINVIRYLYKLDREHIDEALSQQILENLIDEDLLEAEAARRGIEITDEDLADSTEQFDSTLQLLYKTGLNQTVHRLRLRVTEDQIVDYQRGVILTSKIYVDVTKGVVATDEDILALYEEYKEELEEAGLSFEEAKETLAQDALQQKQSEVYAAFLNELRNAAEITVPE